MVVAIDGPAGAGKSSLSVHVANQFNFFNLNSGAFYRAVALKVLEGSFNPENKDEVLKAAEAAEFDVAGGELLLDGAPVEQKLRTDAVDHWSSVISAIVPVRHVVNRHLRKVSKDNSLVAEGRDMTTVVFPDADVKIYLDADPAVRAKRRFDQGGSLMDVEEIEKAIRLRDKRDREKEEGSLIISKDAEYIDSSALTFREVCEKVIQLIQYKQEKVQ